MNPVIAATYYGIFFPCSIVRTCTSMGATPIEQQKRIEGHRIIIRSAGDVISQHYTEGFAPLYDLIQQTANVMLGLSEKVQLYRLISLESRMAQKP